MYIHIYKHTYIHMYVRMYVHMYIHTYTYTYIHTYIYYVLLKALPPICMKFTAQGERQVAIIAQGETECYICHETLIKSFYFYTN